ncbi:MULTISPECIES: family 20 glycosylhydrolase [Sphingobacterium]|jgi:Glycosyl hydrolase family 20, catalytic domain/Glycosyl hydrolase family 20, domain 2|uniref:family 20 glycosylhydrolase n=1 Tax=Sphingobacterium TaxID=28453 RepID=UPI00257E09FA|nr:MULTISPECIES: family 20 glycosylhydrolase [Sphingobacterium]
MEHQKSITCTLLSGLLVILILISPLCCLPDSIKPPLLPMPHAVSWKTGRYCLPDLVHVHIKGEVENADRQMLSLLLKDWNVTQIIFDNFKNKNITIVCDHELVLPSASLEAYRIDVDEQGIQIEARTSAGVFYALQTLGQLRGSDGKLPYCSITDYPSFRWRGYLVDVGRNFQSMDVLKEQIDIMARYKLNIFHFHFTEDIAWRLISKKYPGLTDSTNMERWKGKYYTVEEMQELIRYCRDRHIQLVPEIDMPGHSAAFRRYFKTDMQSDSGIAILKELVKEFANTYPGLPYLHIGGDEVKIHNQEFLPMMTTWTEDLGLKTIGWEPGGNLQPNTIRQLWMGGPKAITNDSPFEVIDSKHLYINHMDPLETVTTLFYRQLGGQSAENEKLMGATLCSWPDRAVKNENDLFRQNGVYPALLTFAERSWRGGGDFAWRSNIKTDVKGLADFVEFEKRLLTHKQLYFNGLIFPYHQQSRQKWILYGPVENKGDLGMALKNEATGDFNALKKIGEFYGGTIVLRHWWADVVKGAIDRPLENSTVYALSKVWSEKGGNQGFWIGFNDLSRSYASDSPHLGTWDDRMSTLWVNGHKVLPPDWQQAGKRGDLEIPLIDEGYSYRSPTMIQLRKGWNTIVVKLPVGKLQGKDWQNPLKWMFTCLPIEREQ